MKALVSYLSQLTDDEFEAISALVKSLSGINLHAGKRVLTKARLVKRLRALELTDFSQYLDYLREDATGDEIIMMLNEISTNETEFFREPAHFGYLADKVLPSLVRRGARRLRIWSAGCSSGEEAYSLAITLCESLSDLAQWDAKILATDLSTRAIAQARRGIYDEQCLGGVPAEARRIYFRRADVKGGTAFRIAEPVRRLVNFARLNLVGDWPMSGPFDAIFCRNVMIYFDKPTRESLIDRFWELLAPGGVLFIGYSESLADVKHRFRYDQPAVYERSK